LTETEEGVKDRLVGLPEEYRLSEEDVRKENTLHIDVAKGIVPPNYLREVPLNYERRLAVIRSNMRYHQYITAH
jgi:hypothetical protein